jgi:hypothetical protein
MKIDNYHLLVVCFVTISLSLLTGFENPEINNADAISKQTVSIKTDQARNKVRHVDLKSIKSSKNKPSILRIDENAELPKSLNLSIPFNDSENIDLKTEQNSIVGESSNIFAAEHKRKSQPLMLDGQMLMSQEPEMDKRKSLDGAGIIINLKR